MISVRIRLFLAGICFLAACSKDPLPPGVFREIQVPVSQDLTSVWFADSLHGVATSGAPWMGGAILSSADGGQSWKIDTLVNTRLECVMFDAAGYGYVCGMDGLVLFRAPGLPWWYTARVDYCWNRGCYFWDRRRGITVAGEGFQGGQIRKIGPEIWLMDTLHTYPNALSGVWYSDSTTVHAVGMGWILRSDDGGNSWTRLNYTGDFYRSVQFVSPSTGYICGYSGSLLKTTDGGRSWQTLRDGGSFGSKKQPFRALWFVSAEKGYVVGDDGLFWRTENGGVDWTPLAGLPETVDAADIFVLGRRGWIACDGGRMFYFEE